jgi:hypothetical protein
MRETTPAGRHSAGQGQRGLGTLTIKDDGSVIASGKHPGVDRYRVGAG